MKVIARAFAHRTRLGLGVAGKRHRGTLSRARPADASIDVTPDGARPTERIETVLSIDTE
jgi:hypothetical protein